MKSAGFTLLELLIATALLAMLTVVLFGGVRFGTRVWETAESSAAGTDRVLAAQATLSNEIAAAYPLFIRVSATDAHAAFEGGPDRLTFLAPAKSPRGALEWVTIGTVTQNGVRSLAMWTALELSPDSRPRLAATLLKGVRSLDIDYFGAYSPRDPPAWRRDWSGAVTIPSLVRVRATLVDGHTVWPELTVATHVSVDQGCVYDQLTHYCQGRI
ncbi:MAG: prepilin-type N-terminal cleavage/methylation domain-containing protein [Alphaproteobacteria bacterium]|nr:prepilin-type N-terminal cleavage/methylation domain-containing protein [Alphaproteobacteria bacterium]